MAFFTAIGVISNDIVRRETQNGVVTTFRLETGAPRGRKLWIDVECWGHLAGTIAHHGEKGRALVVSGELIQREWRDRDGDRRARHLVCLSHAYFISTSTTAVACENTLLVVGRVDCDPTTVEAGSGLKLELTICATRGHSSRHRVAVPATVWRPNANKLPDPKAGQRLSASGSLSLSKSNGLVLEARSLQIFEAFER